MLAPELDKDLHTSDIGFILVFLNIYYFYSSEQVLHLWFEVLCSSEESLIKWCVKYLFVFLDYCMFDDFDLFSEILSNLER